MKRVQFSPEWIFSGNICMNFSFCLKMRDILESTGDLIGLLSSTLL